MSHQHGWLSSWKPNLRVENTIMHSFDWNTCMYTNFCSCVSTLTTLSTGYLVRTYNVLTFLSNQHILAKLSSFFSPADDNNDNDNEPNWSLYCQLSWLVGGWCSK